VPGIYCRSKLAADRLASDAARSGAPVVIVHPTMPVGPGDRRLAPPTAMILGFLRGRHSAYYDAAFNLVDVRDASAGFAAAEAWATLVSHRPPLATVAGVRLVRSPLSFHGTDSWRALGLASRPLVDSLVDLIADLVSRVLVTGGRAWGPLSS